MTKQTRYHYTHTCIHKNKHETHTHYRSSYILEHQKVLSVNMSEASLTEAHCPILAQLRTNRHSIHTYIKLTTYTHQSPLSSLCNTQVYDPTHLFTGVHVTVLDLRTNLTQVVILSGRNSMHEVKKLFKLNEDKTDFIVFSARNCQYAFNFFGGTKT